MVVRRGLPKANIIDMEDYAESQNWCIYGPTGAGKTPWCAMLPGTLIVRVDVGGTVSAKRAGSTAKVAPIHSWQDFEVVYKYLRSNPRRFRWVVFDTLNMLHTRLLRSILENEYKRNPRKRRNIYIPEIQDHQMWQNVLKNYVTDLIELPFNTIWISQEMERENAEGDPVVWPLLPGGKQGYEMAAWFLAQVHVIGRMSAVMMGKGDQRRPVRRVLFEPRAPYSNVRDRFGVLPASVIAYDPKQPSRATPLANLVSLIDEAPPEVRQLAARRVAERDDNVQLADIDADEAPARPRRTRRRTAA